MVKFFRDVLDGPLYFIVAILAIILIMAIIGFMLEKKLNKEKKDSTIAYVGTEVKQAEPVNVDTNNNENITE